MRTLFYCGLEPYQSRYTYQLTEWNTAVFKRRGIDYQLVAGDLIDNSGVIVTGQVLDAHGRSYYSLTQMARLVALMREGKVTAEDVIYFEDMFTPGIEALPYILNQVPKDYRPTVYVRCLAQSIDPDDFIHVWKMAKWMSLYEKMLNEFVVVLASSEEMVAHAKIAGWKAPIFNISGLAFGKQEVLSRCTPVPFDARSRRVSFAARWDQEKQPDFFMDLIEQANDPTIEFALLCGGPLRSNLPPLVERAQALTLTHNFKIYENLPKNEYYRLLADSRVLFNCALQDWVSNTVSEADALGTNVLFPAYRSFPEIFDSDYTRMYVPWSIEDALLKLRPLLEGPHERIGQISDYTDRTVDRILDIMQGKGAEYDRSDAQYRSYLSRSKYG